MSVVLVDTRDLYIRVSDETARTHVLCAMCKGYRRRGEPDFVHVGRDLYVKVQPLCRWCGGAGLLRKDGDPSHLRLTD